MTDFVLNIEDREAKYAFAPDGSLDITVLGEDAQVFHRRSIKMLPSGEQQRDSMLVGRLGDVSIYVRGNQLIMSREDLYL